MPSGASGTATGQPLLRVQGVHKSFGDLAALRDVRPDFRR
jgi:ABC-type branched-subunit amino acid transport system ATPase component